MVTSAFPLGRVRGETDTVHLGESKPLRPPGAIPGTSPGSIGCYGFEHDVADVVYRGHFGYIPGFQVYRVYSGVTRGKLVSDYEDDIADVLYRGHVGYIPGFQVFGDYSGVARGKLT